MAGQQPRDAACQALYLPSTSLFAGQFHAALPSVQRGPKCTFSHVTRDSSTLWLLLVTEQGNLGGKVRTESAVVLWEGPGLGSGLLFDRLSRPFFHVGVIKLPCRHRIAAFG